MSDFDSKLIYPDFSNNDSSVWPEETTGRLYQFSQPPVAPWATEDIEYDDEYEAYISCAIQNVIEKWISDFHYNTGLNMHPLGLIEDTLDIRSEMNSVAISVLNNILNMEDAFELELYMKEIHDAINDSLKPYVGRVSKLLENMYEWAEVI